jgi:hypothetical protein
MRENSRVFNTLLPSKKKSLALLGNGVIDLCSEDCIKPMQALGSLLAFVMLQQRRIWINMKQTADNLPDEAAEQETNLQVVENSRTVNGNTNAKFVSTRETRRTRPEIAVLGWSARFYRLALRQSKA